MFLAPFPPSSPLPPHSSPDPRRTTLRRLDSCSTMLELRQYHSQLVRLGLADDNDAAGRLLRFCALSPSGDLAYAIRLFHRLPNPDPFIYNTLIRAHSHSHSPSSYYSAALLYSEMLLRSVPPNNFTFPPLIKSICTYRALDLGKQVHAHVLKLGFHPDECSQNNLINMYLSCSLPYESRRVFDSMIRPNVVSWTSMISGYARFGMFDDARDMFEKMREKNSVSWNTMIAVYVQSGQLWEAFGVFDRMRAAGVGLDKFVSATMLSACAELGALEQGRWIHGHIMKNGIELDLKLATTVIDMYCKCGCLERAYEVFNGLRHKGLSSWNCMIGGLATHGQGEAAIELFKDMEKETVTPDDITLLNILTACSHSGLVQEGRHYFDYMVQAYGIKPKMEHFGCLVDLFGRAGLLEEAKKIIEGMPMDPDASVLGALLGACKIHGDIELGEQIGKQVIDLEPENSGRYVLLANMLASAGWWDDVAEVRRLMVDRGVSKEPGCSMIELDGAVNEFIAGGKSHPEAREIYAKVDEMLQRIRSEGYVPDTDGVVHDVDEEERKIPVYYHSEKLAIAFGLLHTTRGETIRISKNLRVYRDCHAASKLVSRVFDREIIVRDRKRFHHFKRGECSCKDYW